MTNLSDLRNSYLKRKKGLASTDEKIGLFSGGPMQDTKIKNVASFKCKFVTATNGTVFVRFDFESFFEWYEFKDKTFRILKVETAEILEALLQKYESSTSRNVIYLGEI